MNTPGKRNAPDVAGAMWREYGAGSKRTRFVADFIGTHAQIRGGRLLTHDRGFFRCYFTAVLILRGEVWLVSFATVE